jgi:thiol-disulfide isomerase/thioredoxin
MISKHCYCFLLVFALLALAVGDVWGQTTPAAPAAAQMISVDLKLVPEGIRNEGAGYYPVVLSLQRSTPAGLKKTPALDPNSLYGELRFGPKESETTYLLIVEEPDGKPAKLYFDANRNGDLTDDPEVEWKPKAYKGGTEEKPVDLNQYEGSTWVELPQFGPNVRLRLNFYRFDKKDTGRPQLREAILYYLDYALKGTVTLGGKTYKAMLRDRFSSADFSRLSSAGGMDYPLDIDLNGDGKFAGKSEIRDARKPFNIGGTTYEFANWTVSGSKLAIVKSTQTAEEIPLSPAQVPSANGDKMLQFSAKALDGQTIDFPSGYKGKIVMLDLWATWCGPCLAEVPNLVKAYESYHDKGFEIVGLSLDSPNAEAKIKEVTVARKMTWPQVYDGKSFSNEQVEKLGIKGIPKTYLVDGDTGIILAQGDEIHGNKLVPALEKALASKKTGK